MMILKLSFYLETIFFTLGGNFHLVTNYIIAHHTTYPAMIWYAISLAPGGQSICQAVINLTTHLILLPLFIAIMLFPSLKFSWSKQFFVWVHIVQFTLMLIHGLQSLYDNSCNFSMKVAWVSYAWGSIMIGLYLFNWCIRSKSRVKIQWKIFLLF